MSNNRKTYLLVTADVEITYTSGKVMKLTMLDIPCVWNWDEMERESAEYWCVFKEIGDNWINYKWFSILSWSSTPNPVYKHHNKKYRDQLIRSENKKENNNV